MIKLTHLICVLTLLTCSLSFGASNAESEGDVIAIATEEIPAGERISLKSLTFAPWPTNSHDFLSRGDLRALFETGEPLFSRVDIAAGQAVPSSAVSASAEISELTDQTDVATNLRSFTIKLDRASAISGLLLPGDLVDVVLTRKTDQGTSSQILLQRILIESTSPEAPAVTLEVSPMDAQKLALAQQAGTLSVTLRGMESEVLVGDGDRPILDSSEILELAPEPDRSPEPGSPSNTVRVRRGGSLSIHDFDTGSEWGGPRDEVQ